MANIILVSEGVRVLRVSARTFMWVSPRKGVEEYLKKVYKPPTFPSSEEMCARYHINISWSEFKKNVVNTSRLEKAGEIISNIPATLKGTTGWAKWPGYRLRPRNRMSPLFGKDRLISLSDEILLNDDDDDDDNVHIDDFGTLSSATESSAFLDDLTSMMSARSIGGSSSRIKSPASIRKEKVTSDHSMTIDPPVYRTAAHLRNSLDKKPLDSRSV